MRWQTSMVVSAIGNAAFGAERHPPPRPPWKGRWSIAGICGLIEAQRRHFFTSPQPLPGRGAAPGAARGGGWPKEAPPTGAGGTQGPPPGRRALGRASERPPPPTPTVPPHAERNRKKGGSRER